MTDPAGPDVMWAITKRVRHLAQLQRELPVQYERVETFQNGESLSVKERGTPYLYNHEFGMPMLAGDGGTEYPWGRAILWETTRPCASGGYECITRILLSPTTEAKEPAAAPEPPKPPDEEAVATDLLTDAEVQADVRGTARYAVVVVLRDAEKWRLPPAFAAGPVNGRFGRPDHAGELRKELLARKAESRGARGESFVRWLQAHGGEVEERLFNVANAVRCTVDAETLARVAKHPDVREVKRGRARRRGRADAPATNYLCEGAVRFDDSDDSVDEPDSACKKSNAGYLDARLAAINAYAYLDAGYTGAGYNAVGALAGEWARIDELKSRASLSGSVDADVPHLTLALVETGAKVASAHPAFERGSSPGDSRFVRIDIAGEADPENDATHPTQLAGIAIGNITDGQDLPSRLDGTVAQEARSGVARRALGAFSNQRLLTVLDDFSGAGTLPTDVILQAETLNNSDVLLPSTERDDVPEYCPTNDEARGVDDRSQAIVDAFLEHSVLYVKSAGNFDHGDDMDDICHSGGEVGAPGASAAALVVGNLAAKERTAQQVQDSKELDVKSARGPTGDGRTYPLLVAPGAGCGVPTTGGMYDEFSGTSAASATVAGAALLFKHWYLANYPLGALDPGRIMAHLLNMADGKAYDDDLDRQAVPYPGWGLGRFRLRLFEDTGMGGDEWSSQCRQVFLSDGGADVVNLGEGEPDGKIPISADRLRITIWWLEPNTGGVGRTKAAWQVVEEVLAGGVGEADAAEKIAEWRAQGVESRESLLDEFESWLNWRLQNGALLRALVEAVIEGVVLDGEEKPDIWATVGWTDADGTQRSVTRSSGRDNVMRLQFERGGDFPEEDPVPTGYVELYLSGMSIPAAERYLETGSTTRTLYVSWFWESGPDPSLIDCEGSASSKTYGQGPGDLSGTTPFPGRSKRGDDSKFDGYGAGPSGGPAPGSGQAAVSATDGAKMLEALERKIRSLAAAKPGFESRGLT